MKKLLYLIALIKKNIFTNINIKFIINNLKLIAKILV